MFGDFATLVQLLFTESNTTFGLALIVAAVMVVAGAALLLRAHFSDDPRVERRWVLRSNTGAAVALTGTGLLLAIDNSNNAVRHSHMYGLAALVVVMVGLLAYRSALQTLFAIPDYLAATAAAMRNFRMANLTSAIHNLLLGTPTGTSVPTRKENAVINGSVINLGDYQRRPETVYYSQPNGGYRAA